VGWHFLPESPHRTAQTVFLGTALAITAVPVAIKILMDLGALESPVGRTIVAAAIVDDVLSLLLLAFLTALLRTGELLSPLSVLGLLGQISAFFAITTVAGLFVLPKLKPLVQRLMGKEVEFSLLVLVALAFAVLAEYLQMHFIIGAFIAGLFFNARTLPRDAFEAVENRVSGLTKGLLAPVFFASIGMHLEPSALLAVPGFVALLVVAAFVGKLAGAGGSARMMGLSSRDSMTIGVAMSARGAVELVIADVAMRAGLFSQPTPPPPVVANMFSAVVVVAVATTFVAPIGLRLLIPKKRERLA
jgi:Kef-type K+ transport system membrane component KefB